MWEPVINVVRGPVTEHACDGRSGKEVRKAVEMVSHLAQQY